MMEDLKNWTPRPLPRRVPLEGRYVRLEPLSAAAHGQATPTRPGTFGAYVVTDDVDAVYQRAKAAGAEIIAEPHDTDYGSHDFAAADPEGNRWSFGTYRGEPRKNQ